MKLILDTKNLILILIIIVSLSHFAESIRRTKYRASSKVKNSKKSLQFKDANKDDKEKPKNYQVSKAKIKLDYDTIDPLYKNEDLKESDAKLREDKLNEHTIKKVFELFDIKEDSQSKCYSELNLKFRSLLMRIIVDRTHSSSKDKIFLRHKKEIPQLCLEPLVSMKTNLELKRNVFLDLIRKFKKTKRRINQRKNQI